MALREKEEEVLKAREREASEKRRLQDEQTKLDEAWSKLEAEKRKPGSSGRSAEAKRQSLLRARSSLSKDHALYAETVEDLITKASPRKQKLLHQKGIGNDHIVGKIISNTVIKQMSSLCKSRKKKDLQMKRILAPALQISKKYRCQKKVSKALKITTKLLMKPIQKPHKRRVAQKTTEMVQSFFEKNSITLPDKKLVSKKTHKPTGFLTITIRSLHANFLKEYPHVHLASMHSKRV